MLKIIVKEGKPQKDMSTKENWLKTWKPTHRPRSYIVKYVIDYPWVRVEHQSRNENQQNTDKIKLTAPIWNSWEWSKPQYCCEHPAQAFAKPKTDEWSNISY